MGQGSRPAILLFLIIVFFVCFQVYTFFGVNRTFSKLLVVHGMKRDEENLFDGKNNVVSDTYVSPIVIPSSLV